MPAAATNAMTAGSTASAGTGAARNAAPGTACGPRSSSGPSAPSGRRGPPAAAARCEPWRENEDPLQVGEDRKSTRLNSSHSQISYAVFCLKKKKKTSCNKGVGDHQAANRAGDPG